jgi:hypothetical protein
MTATLHTPPTIWINRQLLFGNIAVLEADLPGGHVPLGLDLEKPVCRMRIKTDVRNMSIEDPDLRVQPLDIELGARKTKNRICICGTERKRNSDKSGTPQHHTGQSGLPSDQITSVKGVDRFDRRPSEIKSKSDKNRRFEGNKSVCRSTAPRGKKNDSRLDLLRIQGNTAGFIVKLSAPAVPSFMKQPAVRKIAMVHRAMAIWPKLVLVLGRAGSRNIGGVLGCSRTRITKSEHHLLGLDTAQCSSTACPAW